MERFEDPDLSDEEDGQVSRGHLNEEQTDALFGGGVLEKKKDHKVCVVNIKDL